MALEPEWIRRQLPGVGAVGAWLILVCCLALLVRRRWPDQPEWSRKVVHIGSGPVLLLAWGLGIDRRIALPVAGLVTLLAALNHRIRVLPAIEDVDRRSYGTIAYGATIVLLLLLWWPAQPAAVAAGVLVMAWGDGFAGLIGPSWPSPSWQVWGQKRSLLGTATMALASLGALALVRQLALAAGLTAPDLGALAAMALLATTLEQVAWLGMDNLSVPLAVAALWRWWSGG
jgi:phytol kinase